MVKFHTIQCNCVPGFPGFSCKIVKRVKCKIIILHHTIFPVQIIVSALSWVKFKLHLHVAVSDKQSHFIHPVIFLFRLVIEYTIGHVIVITDDRYCLLCRVALIFLRIHLIIYVGIPEQATVPAIVSPSADFKLRDSDFPFLYRIHLRHCLKIIVFITRRIR